MTRRSHGTGRLFTRADANGRETYYGSWYVHGRRVKRKIGLKRTASYRDGLTITMANAELRRMMAETKSAAARGDRIDVGELGARYLVHLELLGRKRSTIGAVESAQRVWLTPRLGDRALDRVRIEDVEDLMRSMQAAGVGPKSIRNYVGTLSAMYRYAMHPRRQWASLNPCDGVDLPPVPPSTQVRFLTVDEAESLASAAVEGPYQALDAALYVTATMTGMRQGEVIALRWRDVDWSAQKIRVRQNHVLGEFDTPKSRRSVRSVPMSSRVAGELDAWSKASRWVDDDDLVFADPFERIPLRRGALMRRYRRALKAAQLDGKHRFHDLRHTFGTAMAAAGVPMRTLQEWMGHGDIKTTQLYADYAPNPHEAALVEAAFAPRGSVRGSNLSESENISDDAKAA